MGCSCGVPMSFAFKILRTYRPGFRGIGPLCFRPWDLGAGSASQNSAGRQGLPEKGSREGNSWSPQKSAGGSSDKASSSGRDPDACQHLVCARPRLQLQRVFPGSTLPRLECSQSQVKGEPLGAGGEGGRGRMGSVSLAEHGAPGVGPH